MKPLRVPITASDRAIADYVEQHADPISQSVLSTLTWGADEHLLIATAAAFWLLSRTSSDERRTASLHLLTVSIVASRLPKLFKGGFNQTRPDRLAPLGHAHGIGVS